MKRPVRSQKAEGGNHFLSPSKGLGFIKTGCTLLDLVIGGGLPLGRISNIVGDKSTGKSLLAIEAVSNFARDYPNGRIWYRESEAAFDESYAEALGMPLKRVKFWPKDKPFDTVEDFFEDLRKQAGWCIAHNRPGLYILDSLDALSDRKELERAVDKGSYGTDKARQMSQLFRKLTRALKAANMHVIIISQVRDKIGISFGRKTTRSGGKALDFYASVVLYLAHKETLYRKRRGQKRAVGVKIRAKCDKNKVGLPFRECEFTIRFGYGVDDNKASLDWLASAKRLNEADIKSPQAAETLLEEMESMSPQDYKNAARRIKRATVNAWQELDKEFLPTRRKYEVEK